MRARIMEIVSTSFATARRKTGLKVNARPFSVLLCIIVRFDMFIVADLTSLRKTSLER